MSSSRPSDPHRPGGDTVTPTTAVEVLSAARPRRRPPRKLRTTLIISVLAMVTVVCGAIAVTTEVALSNYLVGQLDSQLFSTKNQLNGNGRGDRLGENGAPTGYRDGGNTSAAGTAAPEATSTAVAQTAVPGSDVVPTSSFATPSFATPPFAFDAPTECTPTDETTSGGAPLGLFQPGVSLGTLAVWVRGTDVRAGILTGPQLCEEPAAADLATLLALSPDAGPVTVSIEGRGDYRVQVTQFADGAISVTGLPLSGVRDTQVRLGVIMAIVMVLALMVAAVIVFFLVRRSLRPLERVAATARQVATVPLHRGEVDLGIRVPARDTDPGTEVGQVGAALNQMLGHVSDALTARQASEVQVRQFVADASHELRTPLASIRGYAELARRDEANAETVSHALRRVQSESQRMSSLVDDLLLLARLDAGRPLSAEVVDLTMLVVDVVSDAQVAGSDHVWQLDLPDEPVEVRGDPPRLHQILANLLTNARTHTPAGTTVRTRLHTENDAVVLTVSDNGQGIDPPLQSGIFDRFVRGDSSRSRQAGSTGLGLAIVKAVVTAHAGTVTVESAPGRTVFTVILPGQV